MIRTEFMTLLYFLNITITTIYQRIRDQSLRPYNIFLILYSFVLLLTNCSALRGIILRTNRFFRLSIMLNDEHLHQPVVLLHPVVYLKVFSSRYCGGRIDCRHVTSVPSRFLTFYQVVIDKFLYKYESLDEMSTINIGSL